MSRFTVSGTAPASLRSRFLQLLGLLAALYIQASSVFAALTLDVSITPIPAEPGEELNVSLTVANSDGFDRSDVVLTLRYPEYLAGMFDSSASDGGDCPSPTCDTNEFLVRDLGALPAVGIVDVTLPPQVHPDTAPGSLIRFDAVTSDATARAPS